MKSDKFPDIRETLYQAIGSYWRFCHLWKHLTSHSEGSWDYTEHWAGHYFQDFRSEIPRLHLPEQSYHVCSAGNKRRGKWSQKWAFIFETICSSATPTTSYPLQVLNPAMYQHCSKTDKSNSQAVDVQPLQPTESCCSTQSFCVLRCTWVHKGADQRLYQLETD